MGSDRKQQGKRGQRISPRYGDQQVREVYIDFFYLGEQAERKKNGVRKVPEVGTTHLGALGLVPTRVHFLEVSYFPNFCYIPKLTENIFAAFLESVYLPYHVPPYFHDSGVFRKDSFMCSSDVKVLIALLSTLMGVPEM